MNRTVSWRESRRSFLTGSLAKEEASVCVSRRRSLPYAFRAGSCRSNCIHAFCICSCRLADKDRRPGTRIAFSITRSTPFVARVSHPPPSFFFRSDPASSKSIIRMPSMCPILPTIVHPSYSPLPNQLIQPFQRASPEEAPRF